MPRWAVDGLNDVGVLVPIAICIALIAVSINHVVRHYRAVALEASMVTASSVAVSPDPSDDLFAATEATAIDWLEILSLGSSTIIEVQGTMSSPPTGSAAPQGPAWIPILMYHYVRVVSPRDRAVYALSVTPDDLGRQLDYLKNNGYTTLTMAQVDQILEGKMLSPAKPVALTFDDGFIDFYAAAAPLLRQNGMTATDYIPTQMVGSGRPVCMTWDQVQQLDREGFEMAAHSQNHVDVSRVSLNRAKIEIFGSKVDLEQRLGHSVIDWAYPYGGYNAVVANLVQQAGFASAATTNPGAYHDAGQMLTLTRLRAGGGQSLEQFAASLKPPG